MRRWRPGSYTLVHDHDPSQWEAALDARLCVAADGWEDHMGGFTSYIARGEDTEVGSGRDGVMGTGGGGSVGVPGKTGTLREFSKCCWLTIQTLLAIADYSNVARDLRMLVAKYLYVSRDLRCHYAL